MKGINPYPLQSSDIQENWRTTNQIADELYFRKWLFAENGEPTGAGAVKALVGPAGGPLPGFQLPDAASTNYRWIIPLDPMVGPSQARITFWYSSPAGSTNNFGLAWSIFAYEVGALTVTTVGTTGVVNYAGPAVANTPTKGGPFVLSTNPFIYGRHLCLRALLVRDGAGDANNGAFDFIQALLEILPDE